MNFKKISYLFELEKLEKLEKDTFIKFCFIYLFEGLSLLVRDILLILLLYKIFHNPNSHSKSFLVIAQHIALFLSMFVVSWIKNEKLSNYSAIFNFIAGLCLVILAFLKQSLITYIILGFTYAFFISLKVPLNNGIFQKNLNSKRLPGLFSTMQTILFISRFLFGMLITYILSLSLDYFKYIYMIIGFTTIISSFMYFFIKEEHKRIENERKSIFSNLKLLKDYPDFRYVLFVWFFLGISNVFMLNFRIAYLSDDNLGLKLSVSLVLIINEIIPQLTKIFSNRILAFVYSKINFGIFRLVCNIFILIGTTLFLSSSSISMLIIAQIIQNIGLTGGMLSWNIWVNRIAPQGQAQNFMSVHTFFAGIRGVIATSLVFHIFEHFSKSSILYGFLTVYIVATILALHFIKIFKNK